jgi:hypothetical protein
MIDTITVILQGIGFLAVTILGFNFGKFTEAHYGAIGLIAVILLFSTPLIFLFRSGRRGILFGIAGTVTGVIIGFLIILGPILPKSQTIGFGGTLYIFGGVILGLLFAAIGMVVGTKYGKHVDNKKN